MSAFLLTVEAALQYIKDQWPRSGTKFDDWLKAQPEHDVLFRGLRTLRHTEAHVEKRNIGSLISVNLTRGADRSAGRTQTSVARMWKLPRIQPSDLAKLRTPALDPADLPAYNAFTDQSDVNGIFDQGLRRLAAICAKAESLV